MLVSSVWLASHLEGMPQKVVREHTKSSASVPGAVIPGAICRGKQGRFWVTALSSV